MTGFGLITATAEGSTISYDTNAPPEVDFRDPEEAFDKYESIMRQIDRLAMGDSFTQELREHTYTVKRTEYGFLSLRMPKQSRDTYVQLDSFNREVLNNRISGWVQEEISLGLRQDSEDEVC